ncbi:MAG TPA: choice-of-anchor C family protein [Caulobacteraceae bacterium]
MKMYFRAAGVLALTLALGGAAHASNLVTDGNFDSPSGGGSFTTYFASQSFSAWTVDSGSVDLIGGYWQAPAGAGSVDLDGNSPGAISQSITTGKGAYELTFDLSGNPDGGPVTKTVQVTVGNATQTFTYDLAGNSHSDMMYVPESLKFTTSGPTTLTFTSLDVGTPYGPVIGNVSVAGVPEPASWALMLLGAGALGGALRARRSRTAGLA